MTLIKNLYAQEMFPGLYHLPGQWQGYGHDITLYMKGFPDITWFQAPSRGS